MASFSIYSNGILNPDSNGNGTVTINQSTLTVPQNVIPGAPTTLADLTNAGVALTLSYYIQATGSVSSHDCWATYTLYVSGTLPNSVNINKVAIAKTSNDPDRGGSVNSGWQPLITSTTGVIQTITSSSDCTGSGCGCAFQSKGGWKGVTIDLRIDVVADLLDYCTQGQNISQDMCYNYISDYITSQGPSQAISTYLADYCANKYPNGNLSLFNDPSILGQKDYAICACNMPDQDYQQFYQSIDDKFPNLALGSIRANCLLPACVTSPFKSNELDGCPIPQCLEVVDINSSNIVGNVKINQSANCAQYGIMGPPAPPGTVPPMPPVPSTNGSFLGKYKWWILGIIVLMILIIILIIVFAKMK